MKNSIIYFGIALFCVLPPVKGETLPDPVTISSTSDWKMQDIARVTETGDQISQSDYHPNAWYKATVPGTVLTTLVDNGVYPEPLYGENNRPDKIPESLCRTSYWYRTSFTVPAAYAGHKIWLNFDGINYAADVWVNGKEEGSIKGAFIRGIFDISSEVKAGESATLAVLVHPQPHPGNPHEHTIANGTGHNGGITAMDGPTFLCTIGWDWIPGIRDRDTGIWQKVFLSASGPVLIQEPLVTTDVALPGLESADVKIQATLKNVTDQPQSGVLRGTFGDAAFQQPVSVDANSTQVVTLDPSTTPQLHLQNPRLWWPNGYGPQNLYPVHLAFEAGGAVSDATDFSVGVRKVTYTVPGTDNLTVSVNGVPVVCKGGDWGMDEAMKRIPRERLEAQIRMHQLANYTIIRNWVGQSTSEDFYGLCDKYGIMLWDEFFQPSPFDGDNPADLGTYLANARDKIVRFRNHPSIVIWCGRNEGYPPENVNEGLKKLMAELEPTRLYQPSSTNGHGVHSGGPYIWRTPQDFYHFDEPFKTEIGSVSVPTLEAVQAMMPRDDWESINDDWAEHDLADQAKAYPEMINNRYGKVLNLADFVRKAQLANYEAFRAMYEGRFAKLFHPTSGVITWMSNPAQPSFVWQIYSWDLEPNASFFAVKKACEPVHVMLNEDNGHVEVINNHSTPLSGAKATVAVYNSDGTLQYSHDWEVEAPASEATDLGAIDWPGTLSNVHFIKVVLQDALGQVLSDNFYWRGIPDHKDDLQDLDSLPTVKLDAQVTRHDRDGKCLLDVTMTNPSDQIALMAHMQLRRETSGERVLPVYYTDNYLSFVPHETKTLTIEASQADLKGEKPLIVVDGWNIDVTPATSADADVALNKQALVSIWPVTGLPIVGAFRHPLDQIKVNCGGGAVKDFVGDAGCDAGSSGTIDDSIDCSAASAAPAEVYQSERYGDFTYTFPMKASSTGYLVRLHFAETKFDSANQRVFNVEINGKAVLSNFDIFAVAGAKDKAVVKEFPGIFPDKDGNVIVHFRPDAVDNPKIDGIEIVPSDP